MSKQCEFNSDCFNYLELRFDQINEKLDIMSNRFNELKVTSEVEKEKVIQIQKSIKVAIKAGLVGGLGLLSLVIGKDLNSLLGL